MNYDYFQIISFYLALKSNFFRFDYAFSPPMIVMWDSQFNCPFYCVNSFQNQKLNIKRTVWRFTLFLSPNVLLIIYRMDTCKFCMLTNDTQQTHADARAKKCIYCFILVVCVE